MNTALWIAQGVLAAVFAMSGTMKLAKSREQLEEQLAWVEDFSDSTVKLIGTAELLGAIGLVLPPLLDIAPWLAPLAATGLGAPIVLPAVTHVRHKEPAGIVLTVLRAANASVIAWR